MPYPAPVVSGATEQRSGDAGGTANDALDAAFNKAFESVDAGDSEFAESAAPARKGKREPTEPAPENAAEAEPGSEVEAKTEAETDPDKAKAAEPAAKKTPETEKAEQEQKPDTVISPPAHWDAKRREAFGKLTPDAQTVILDLSKHLETEFTKKSTGVAEDRKFAQGVRALINDGHREQLRRSGLSEVDGIARLVQLNDWATQDAPGYVRWVFAQTGLDPRQVFPQLAGNGAAQPQPGQKGQGEEPPFADPMYQKLNETIQGLRGEITTFKQQQQDSLMTRADRALQAFRAATDESGLPSHPHYDKVEKAMDWILRSNTDVIAVEDFNERLEKAYDLAVYADPTIRNEIIDSEAQRRSEATAKAAEVQKAKRAQAPVKSVTVASPTEKPKGLAATVSEAMRVAGVS